MKNIGNTAETFLKEKSKSIEKIGKNTLQGIKTTGTAVKTFAKKEGKNFKIFLKTNGKNIKTRIKKGAVLAYKGLKKAPRILGQVIGQFTNSLVCALFGLAPGSIGIVLGSAAIGAVGYYAYNHPDEAKSFANSVIDTTKNNASSTVQFLKTWWPF
ncbi:hypothetical protein [Spiroplasma endosymbiont of Ammophila pubescens]|uniref:hypothetical protein n=1 Tax=Spiroplasma endosymbiont of Ammophila pubescens TaxID=3066315 RepID=UPI0032B1C3DC